MNGDERIKLNEPKGNMYPWAYTSNSLGGECSHKCSYCYSKPLGKIFKAIDNKYTGKPRLIESELNTSIKKIPNDKLVFVCSMTDLFADDIPSEYIIKILEYIQEHLYNNYLLQTKNPKRFGELEEYLVPIFTNILIGTTIETNRSELYETNAPTTEERYNVMKSDRLELFEKMISIEPIMKFDLDILSKWIIDINPQFVSIGADSFKNNLTEPSMDEVEELIDVLEGYGVEVKQKANLIGLETR